MKNVDFLSRSLVREQASHYPEVGTAGSAVGVGAGARWNVRVSTGPFSSGTPLQGRFMA